MDFGEAPFLFTGDLEVRAIGDLLHAYEGSDALDVDIDAVGHHGSHNATTAELLAATTRRIAVISMGVGTMAASPRTTSTPSTTATPGATRSEHWRPRSRGPPRRRVPRGERCRRSRSMRIDRAIYGTGWEGAIRIRANSGGTFEVVED